ncbi:zygote arrest protein 1 [Suricata suricatta]|uniref:zygote arrest protein 1 n=1 Tax=Suricata suricatta TaxID=37032 RepID=UPI001155CC9E|nr:zygote arrest protein 1 [Suricata suricatta]
MDAFEDCPCALNPKCAPSPPDGADAHTIKVWGPPGPANPGDCARSGSSSPRASSLANQFSHRKESNLSRSSQAICADLQVWNISPQRRSGTGHAGGDPGTGAGGGRRWGRRPAASARGSEAAPRRAPKGPEQSPPVGQARDAAGQRSSPRSPEQAKERPRFQFLEQKYGYYHCKECNIRWESAYVWCVQGTNKVYFKQFCRTCQKSYNPYRVEDITCQSCKQTRCSCPVKLRHVDPKRPHRQDLCGRCKGKRLSCDSTFSFKYII